MKFLVALSAVLALTTAIPQRRLTQKPEPQQQQAEQYDQQPAEQNYNNNFQQQHLQQQQQQQDRQQQQDYRTQRQDYRQQQQDDRQDQQEYRNQQQSEFRKPIDDFRGKVSLDTTTFIPIISFDKEQGTDGSYKTSYETGNNIHAQESGYLKPVDDEHNALVQSGSYSYTAPDGQIITVEYTADEQGFRVKGDHIPTPPPVSPEIQKGLDLIYAGIKANQERVALEAKTNPEAARQNEDRAVLDYKGHYYQQ